MQRIKGFVVQRRVNVHILYVWMCMWCVYVHFNVISAFSGLCGL